MYDWLQALLTLRTRVGLEIEHAGRDVQVDVVGLDGEEQHIWEGLSRRKPYVTFGMS